MPRFRRRPPPMPYFTRLAFSGTYFVADPAPSPYFAHSAFDPRYFATDTNRKPRSHR